MCDLDGIIPILKATILSTKGSVTIEQCNRDYKELEGEWIPYQRLGFRNLEDLFEKIPGFKLIKQPNGRCLVEANTPKEIRHITEMVARQKHVPTKKQSKRYIQRPVRHLRDDSSWKPAYSKSWQYSKSPKKVPEAYSKPYNKSTHVSAPITKTITPATNTIKDTKTVQDMPVPVKKSELQKSKPLLPQPKKSFVPKEKEVSVTPVSRLSGIRPGDILARALSTSNSTQNGLSDGVKVSSPTTVSVPTMPSVKIVDLNPPAAASIRLSAAERMSALQNRLQKSETLIMPEEEKIEVSLPPDIPKQELSLEFLDAQLKQLSDNKSQLLKTCELMNLPEPIFRTLPTKHKRGNLYDCTVKIGKKHSFTTYPDSLATPEQATEIAAGAALTYFRKLVGEETHPVTAYNTALNRILSIVSEHPNGVWANTLPDMYKGLFSERLPSDWLNLVDKCPNISKEDGPNEMIILLPIDQNLESASPSSSVSSVDKYCGPMPLQYPDTSVWNVYIMSVQSTVEIWLRIIGEEYSESYDSLLTEMELHYMENHRSSQDIVIDGWYALNCEDTWVRARILDLDNVKRLASCFLVDSGDEEVFPFSALHDLPPRFLNLPAQAILCRLAGLEDYAALGQIDKEHSYLSDMLVGKALVAEVLQTPDESDEDPTITVVLFDTSTDVDININKELLRRMSEQATSPQLPSGLSEVYVMDVTASGKVCVQIHNESWKILQQMMDQVVAGPFPKEALQASLGPIQPAPNVYYLAKSSSGKWLRAVCRSGIIEEDCVSLVSVRYMDCGTTERVPAKDLIRLERISDALNRFPPQALYLTLYNISCLSAELIKRFNDMVPYNTPVLCKQISPNSNIVELFVRTQPHNVLCSVNNALIMEQEFGNKLNIADPHSDDRLHILHMEKKRERILLSKNIPPSDNTLSTHKTVSVSKFDFPDKGEYFDVYVSLAANPSNFVVQPLKHKEELKNLMLKLKTHCGKLPMTNIIPSIGKDYAVLYTKHQTWYRVKILGIISNTTVSLYFIDFGDQDIESVENLRELPSNMTNLPAMALRARLHGVMPMNRDWSVTDCIRFQELVKDQCFVSIVENVEVDPVNKDELLLVLNLIDTSTQEDLYLNKLLAKERRAILK